MPNDSGHAALERAVEMAGGINHLAAALGVSRQRLWVVRQNAAQGAYIPWQWAVAIEEKFGISKTEMRPDIWGE